jgi:hypothetical protein
MNEVHVQSSTPVMPGSGLGSVYLRVGCRILTSSTSSSEFSGNQEYCYAKIRQKGPATHGLAAVPWQTGINSNGAGLQLRPGCGQYLKLSA